MNNQLSEKIIKMTIDNGRCLVKISKENKKEIYSLVEESKIDGTIRVVSWGCGKSKYVLFIDSCCENKEGKVLPFKRKAA